MTVASPDYRRLGDLLRQYLKTGGTPEELEAEFVHEGRKGSEAQYKELMSIMHFVYHFDMDASLRAEKPSYGSLMLEKLSGLCDALCAGDEASIVRANDHAWGKKSKI